MKRSGFTLIEIAIAMALLVALAMVTFQVANIGLGGQNRANVTFQADSLRRSMVTYLQNDAAWTKTMADTANLNMLCLQQKTPCAGQGGGIVLDDINGKQVFNALSPQSGFTPQGVACNSFDDTAGNDACPFRFEVTWKPICSNDDPTCLTPPQVQVTGQLKYHARSPGLQTIVNPAKYGFEIVKNLVTTLVAKAGNKIYVANDTFTVPPGVTKVNVVVVGGGGGGGGSACGWGSGGGGGCGGGVVAGTFAVTPGQAIPITVGQGGAGGQGCTDGTPGQPSSFGSLLTAAAGSYGFKGYNNLYGANYGGTGGGSGGGGGGNGWPGFYATPGNGGTAGTNTNSHGAGGDCTGQGWGNIAGMITQVPSSAGAGGAVPGGNNYSGGGGGGGLIINGSSVNGGSEGGTPGGQGYGGGGGGNNYGAAPNGGNGAVGVVYVEWGTP